MRYLGFVLIVILSAVLVFLLVTRTRTAYSVPAEISQMAPAPDAAAEQGSVVDAGAGSGADAMADVGAADAGAGGTQAEGPVVDTHPAYPDAAGDAAASTLPSHPLRVTALGWELIAAGAADTISNLDLIGSPLELAPETTLEAVSARMARGGADSAGADVAVLPLPAFVVVYDRLRALDLRAFAVVGVSRGREELHAAQGAWLKPPIGSDEVKLAATASSPAGDSAARITGSESATLLGLFALDLLGVPPSRVRLVTPGSEDGRAAPFAAITRGTADARRLVLSTADASRLVPVLLVAPRAKLESDAVTMRKLAVAWRRGLERVRLDASGVAREFAGKSGPPLAQGVGEAPDAVALVERFGRIAPVSIADERAWIGPSARAPSSLDTLMRRTWQLARGAGLTPGAEPEPLPIDARVATALGSEPSAASPAPPTPTAPESGDFARIPAKATPLIVYRAGAAPVATADAASVADEIGFLASVFERAVFRVKAKGGEKQARVIAAMVRDRFDVPAARLATASGEPKTGIASVEVLAVP
ncbi:MAG: hypothetical protein FWD73_16060 [Polyangiaceae bacterium]|nr:hypothetical protein [Polyangiaceae bacterium]